MSRLSPSFVLGYHGCEAKVGRQALAGDEELQLSEKAFDWLGPGIYFWEGDAKRALEWAKLKRYDDDFEEPFVIGAIIDLRNCLDLMVREDIEIVKAAAQDYRRSREKAGLPLPKNTPAPNDPSPDRVMRYLDCAVINHLHALVDGTKKSIEPPKGVEPYDTVRALFGEGVEIYDGSGFRAKTHSQIAVRNLRCIKGFFLPRP